LKDNETIVPKECVKPEEFTGETLEIDAYNNVRSTGRVCNIVIILAGRQFSERAVAKPGKDLSWTTFFHNPYRNTEVRNFITNLMDEKFRKSDEETMYTPAKMVKGVVVSAEMVSENTPTITVGQGDVENKEKEDNSSTETKDSDSESLWKVVQVKKGNRYQWRV